MVKRISKLFKVLIVTIVCLALVGCNDNKEKAKWAEKIDDRYNRYMEGSSKTPYSYADLLEKINGEFGESNYGTVTNTDIQAATGILYWIDGTYSAEEIQNRIDNGKRLKGLAISFALGIAVDAYYGNLKDWL